jgi:hypothetical protein
MGGLRRPAAVMSDTPLSLSYLRAVVVVDDDDVVVVVVAVVAAAAAAVFCS